jgi:trk system potassium uptake protein TrkH
MILPFIRIISLLLVIVATTMLFPAGIALYYGETTALWSFLISILISWAAGAVFLFAGRGRKLKMSTRSGFAVVACAWTFASFLGAFPLYLSGCFLSFTDAFFESVSGFTTTGATILASVEVLPISMNVWRCQMHWLGGMGIVALTVALMPLLGVGGFQLIKAETTGPEKGKFTPKITVTAKILWFIYLAFTIIQTVLLMAAGMNFTDAVSHSFASLGTGGYSTRNASIGAYNSPAIDWICTVFMILGGVNFTLYYRAIQRNGKEIFENTELKAYLVIILISVLIVAISILPQYGNFLTSIRYSAFQVVSIITTTGFSTADFTKWAPPAQLVLFFLMFIGGCSGSTGGNIKVIRWVVLGKQMMNEIRRMLHPHGVFSIRLNGRAGRKDLVYSVSAFIFLYFMLVLVTTIVASFDGADIITSFTSSLAMVGNIGPGFGKVGPVENYGFFSPFTKWWFSFAMIAGRLELYTMLVFFMPVYWKK